MKSLIVFLFCIICHSAFCQTPVFDDLTLEEDSINKAYRPAGKKFAFIKSKLGTGGVKKTSKADSILTLPITDIVLVYSESNSSSSREELNRERWENLLQTYPEFFQFNTNYKNLLQYGKTGDSLMKKAKGFYIYFTGNEPTKTESDPVVKTPETENLTETKPEKKSEPEEPTKTKKEKKEKSEAKEKKESKKEEITKKEENEPEIAIKPTVKREGYTKPRRAKNPKACRQPCYVGGDEGLNTFLKENIPLTKKQKKHSKKLISNVKLQLNLDGSIKKSMVTGENEELNKQVNTAINNMDLWNPAIKNGVTVKSEVKMVLIYDKDSKGMKATEMNFIPRPGPKCECVSDEEIFGTE